MTMLILAALANPHAIGSDAALKLCRPVLERKAQGEIARIDVDSSHADRGLLTIQGRLTAFIGMGPPAPGSASAHHLIRADFTYRCTVRGKTVRSATVRPGVR